MLTREENELLTRVEGDAPMGQMMRRHWTPACLAEELPEPGCAPRRLRLFGENLVAFRGLDGVVAILGEHCPHRLASLAYARVEQSSLQCLYHGWKIDGEGRVIELPSEPEGRRSRTIQHLAYPAHEAGGLIWVYMGPQGANDSVPEFPLPPWMDKPDNSIAIAKIHEAANWAQALEGTIDSAHTSTLHSSNVRSDANVTGSTDRGGSREFLIARPSNDRSPRIELQPTSYGFRYAAIRRPIRDPETTDYLRVTVYVAPYIALIPPHTTWRSAQVFVPVDDHNSIFYFIAWSDQLTFDQAAWQEENHAKVGVDLDRDYRKRRKLSNHHLQDREAMKRGDFTGIAGVPNQDMAVQESMGPIVDRTREHLGASDLAIVRFRQMMLQAARAFAAGAPAIGTAAPRLPHTEIRSWEGLVPRATDWRALGVTPAEAAGYRTLAGQTT
jgi:phthalate 4,5-dioxygenase oxygenase subunit